MACGGGSLPLPVHAMASDNRGEELTSNADVRLPLSHAPGVGTKPSGTKVKKNSTRSSRRGLCIGEDEELVLVGSRASFPNRALRAVEIGTTRSKKACCGSFPDHLSLRFDETRDKG